jgi:hypothetical protein
VSGTAVNLPARQAGGEIPSRGRVPGKGGCAKPGGFEPGWTTMLVQGILLSNHR